MRTLKRTCGVAALAFACGIPASARAEPVLGIVHQASVQKPLDVIYVPTPAEVVRQMLLTAKVGRGDVVFDLGSGDGRIPIAAVRDFGAARGVGIELDPLRIAEAAPTRRPPA